MFEFLSRKTIELPGIVEEYHYIDMLRCSRCGGPMKGNRSGSRVRLSKRRIDDIWTLACQTCGKTKRLILSAPMPKIRE